MDRLAAEVEFLIGMERGLNQPSNQSSSGIVSNGVSDSERQIFEAAIEKGRLQQDNFSAKIPDQQVFVSPIDLLARIVIKKPQYLGQLPPLVQLDVLTSVIEILGDRMVFVAMVN